MVFSGAGHYDPEDYPADGFVFDQSQANFYSDVVIFGVKMSSPVVAGRE